jgi:tol-pal system protein YbgF
MLMRIRTHRVALAMSLALTCGCAGSAPGATVHTAHESGAEAELRVRLAAQSQRLEELEARIALLEADARQAREGSGKPLRSGETVRIGTPTDLVSTAPPRTAADDDRSDDATPATRTPHLRLYGRQASDSTREREPLPSVPIVSEKLPVAPLPSSHSLDVHAPEQSAKAAAVSGEASDDAGTDDYRTALRLLRERNFDAALAALSAFLTANPKHALVHHALYWRAEVLYSKRDYAQALSEFEALGQRFPQSEKAPDALLKVALCFRHLGAADKAQAAFRRLRANYPNSQAASIASREGST